MNSSAVEIVAIECIFRIMNEIDISEKWNGNLSNIKIIAWIYSKIIIERFIREINGKTS